MKTRRLREELHRKDLHCEARGRCRRSEYCSESLDKTCRNTSAAAGRLRKLLDEEKGVAPSTQAAPPAAQPAPPPAASLNPKYPIRGLLSKLFGQPGRLVLTMPEALECFLTKTQIQSRLCFEQFGYLDLRDYDTEGVPRTSSFRMATIMMCVPMPEPGDGLLSTGKVLMWPPGVRPTSADVEGLKGCTLFFTTLSTPGHASHIILFRKSTEMRWQWRYIDPNIRLKPDIQRYHISPTIVKTINDILEDALHITLEPVGEAADPAGKALLGLGINSVSHSCPVRNLSIFGPAGAAICYLSPCIEVAVMLAMAGLRNCENGEAVVSDYERFVPLLSAYYPIGFERSLVGRLLPLDLGQPPKKPPSTNTKARGWIEKAIEKVWSHDKCLFVRRGPHARGGTDCGTVRLEAFRPGQKPVCLEAVGSDVRLSEARPSWKQRQTSSCSLRAEMTESLLQTSVLALASMARELKLEGAYEWPADRPFVDLLLEIADEVVVRFLNLQKKELASVVVSATGAILSSFISREGSDLEKLFSMFSEMQSVGMMCRANKYRRDGDLLSVHMFLD